MSYKNTIFCKYFLKYKGFFFFTATHELTHIEGLLLPCKDPDPPIGTIEGSVTHSKTQGGTSPGQ